MKPEPIRVPPQIARAGMRPATGQGLWSTFWQDFCLEGEPHERCHVPGDGRAVVDAHWAAFADGLERGAQVIDLGCGAGVAGCALLRRRGDLQVTGVDWANVPVTRRPNLTIHPWVSMEALPFEDGGFDAAISLFGIEYGDIGKTGAELARVLKPGAAFSFIVHHRESEISREGMARRRALRELIAGGMKAAFLAGDAAGIDRQRQRLRAQFPGEPAVNLFGGYYHRNATRTRAERQAIWQKLAGEIDPEIALLGHLERSAKAPAELGAWLVPLLAGMARVSVAVLRRGSGEPIAWEVSGAR